MFDFSVHIPLWRGTLKVKNEGSLHSYERNRRVPVLRVGEVCFVWKSNALKRRSFDQFPMQAGAPQPDASSQPDKDAH